MDYKIGDRVVLNPLGLCCATLDGVKLHRQKYGRDKEIGGVVVGISMLEIHELGEIISVRMDSEDFYCSEGDGINRFVPECLVLKNKEEEQK
jgi:hypothetical protein